MSDLAFADVRERGTISSGRTPVRLAILTSHPIQYYAPLFRELERLFDVKVFYAHNATPEQQAEAGFGAKFEWDVDLLAGYAREFLRNVAVNPSVLQFSGCDTPDIGAKLTDGSFDALLVTGWHLKTYWQGVAAAKRRGIPILVRGDSQLGTPRSRATRVAKSVIYPLLLRAFDAALYVGQRNRAYYEHYRYPAARLFHAPHCVDTGRFAGMATPELRAATRARLGIASDEATLLFAGKLVAFKRPIDVIEAAAVLRTHGRRTCVLVAGSGPLEMELKARAGALDVPLHLLGFQNQTQMPSAYAAADILVLPSTASETWGLVCNEALACGTPIVVSDAVGCAPDLTADRAAGLSFPVGNVPALADALMSILQAPPRAEAIRRVSDGHSLGAAAAGVVAAVNSVARARESRI